MLIGAVWYQAQLLAFLCTVLAVLLAERKRPTPSLILYALAVGCRPFNAVAGLAVAALLWHRRVPWKKWIPGVCAGLCIGLSYGLYNLARFGSFFEFGHNYLPEFTRSEHGQFSLAYFWDNAKLVLNGKWAICAIWLQPIFGQPHFPFVGSVGRGGYRPPPDPARVGGGADRAGSAAIFADAAQVVWRVSIWPAAPRI